MLRDLVDNFRSPEQACKEYFLRSDIDLTAIVIAAAALLVPPMTYLDYSYYGFTSEFFVTTSIEGLFALFSVIVLLIIRHNNHFRTYERLVFTWTMVITVSSLFATFLQPERIIENILINYLILIAIHLLIINKSSFRIIPAATITVASITALLATDNAASIQQKYLLTLFLIVLNLVGFIVIARNNRFRRLEYGAQNREREARKKYETLAATDSLTGILNHRSFIELAQMALDRSRRYDHSFCLAIFDLDRLKQINDTYGHLAGDKALKQFTTLVASKKRITDVFGRIGGDEFGFILPQVTRTDAITIISRFQDALRALTITSPKGSFSISFCVGVTEVRAEDISPDDLIHRADEALYQAKGKGDDRIETR